MEVRAGTGLDDDGGLGTEEKVTEIDLGHRTAEFVWWRPAAALRPLVAWYCGYRESGGPPERHRGLPSPFLTLIVTLEDPLVIAEHPNPSAPGAYNALVGGLHTTPVMITHDGRQSGVQLGLTPLGARALLGLPAGALASMDMEATEVLGPWVLRLRERLIEAPSWDKRFALIDTALLKHASPDITLPAEVAYAWRRVLSTGGGVSVSELSGEIGWSSRHLLQRFTAEIGLRPRDAARVVRFDRARRTLQQSVAPGTRRTLADVAALSGYCDQAHLAREFGALAGCSPSRWLAEGYPLDFPE